MTSLAIEPDLSEIAVGDEIQLKATATFSNGKKQDVTLLSRWVSIEDKKIPVNNTDRKGVVTALKAGETRISAEYMSKVAVTELKSVRLLRYDDVRQKSAHNTYQREESVLDTLIYHRIRSIEFDIHPGETEGVWKVYHSSLDKKTSCTHLSDCLDQLIVFDKAVPEHEVVTVWMDVKEDWSDSHSPEKLDALIKEKIGEEKLLTPKVLLSECEGTVTLKQAVEKCNWPTLDELKGKFIFVLTEATSRLQHYVGDGEKPGEMAAFTAPEISDKDEVDNYHYQIFFNINGPGEAAVEVFNRGFISRAFNIDSEQKWQDAVTKRVHHIATNLVNYHEDPWAVTHQENWYPFSFIDKDLFDDREEKADIIGVKVNSDDIWSSSDNFYFLYREVADLSEDRSYTTLVSTVGSHVEGWAKGCLMARSSIEPGSSYFAVCRPANDHKLRIQYRLEKDKNSEAVEAGDIAAAGTINQADVPYIKLVISKDSKCASGLGSVDGIEWVSIGEETCFETPLSLDGIASASHGEAQVKFLYLNPKKDEQILTTSSFSGKEKIGTVRSAESSDGIF